MIDLNELSAFIRGNTNLPCLLDLEQSLRDRIQKLLESQPMPANYSNERRPKPWRRKREKCPECGQEV